jgi:hypothetical protein
MKFLEKIPRFQTYLCLFTALVLGTQLWAVYVKKAEVIADIDRFVVTSPGNLTLIKRQQVSHEIVMRNIYSPPTQIRIFADVPRSRGIWIYKHNDIPGYNPGWMDIHVHDGSEVEIAGLALGR